MSPEEASKLLQAYVDGELDPAASLQLEAHLAENPAARAACERLRAISASVRDHADYHSAPAAFAARLRTAVPAAPEDPARRAPRGSWFKLTASLAGVAILASVITVGALRPDKDDVIAQDVFAGHVRATLAGHLTDVVSSDQHTVKPWMSSRLDYSPPVADLSAHGFQLAGGRLDYVGGRSVATLVYRRREHVIDVFVWPAREDAAVQAAWRDGFNFSHFARHGMNFWIVSDLNRNELNDFTSLIATP
jgi:anti-sigma factor RsiW